MRANIKLREKKGGIKMARYYNGERVCCEKNRESYAFGTTLPRRNWFLRLFGVKPISFVVLSSRYQSPISQIGGTYSTIQDDEGNQYEIPECFLVKV